MGPDYFTIAIDLVEQREINALGLKLLELFRRQFPEVQTLIYEVFADNTEIVTLLGSATLVSLTDKPLLLDCLKNRHTVQETRNNTLKSFIFPVRGVARTKQLVAIYGDPIHPAQLKFFSRVIELYSRVFFNLDKQDHDSLTGLLNRSAFDDRLPKLLDNENHRQGFHTDQLCFALIDIDRFKNINDTFGHLYGDEVLILMAILMERGFRYHDLLFRYGGEEFAILLTDVDLIQAFNALERFRIMVSEFQFPQLQSVTISAGLTAIKKNQMLTNVIDRADKALYFAKENGRNKVCVYEDLISHGSLVETTNQGQIELFYSHAP